MLPRCPAEVVGVELLDWLTGVGGKEMLEEEHQPAVHR